MPRRLFRRGQTKVERLCPKDAAVDNWACCAIMRSSRLMELALAEEVDPVGGASACPCMERSASMVAGLDQLPPPPASVLAPASFALWLSQCRMTRSIQPRPQRRSPAERSMRRAANPNNRARSLPLRRVRTWLCSCPGDPADLARRITARAMPGSPRGFLSQSQCCGTSVPRQSVPYKPALGKFLPVPSSPAGQSATPPAAPTRRAIRRSEQCRVAGCRHRALRAPARLRGRALSRAWSRRAGGRVAPPPRARPG